MPSPQETQQQDESSRRRQAIAQQPQASPVAMLSQPGIMRDGTRMNTMSHLDGKWNRFYQDKPLKMAGYREQVRSVLARLSAPLSPGFEVLEGDMVVEIKPAQYDKASAVEEFMREAPFMGRVPVFVGDDITDYDGFTAVQRFDGLSVAVGDRVSAQWYLPDPRAARAWLAQIAGLASGNDG